MVINAVKDVASALGELINTTKNASGKPVNDPYMQELKESAKVSKHFGTSALRNIKQMLLSRFFLINVIIILCSVTISNVNVVRLTWNNA